MDMDIWIWIWTCICIQQDTPARHPQDTQLHILQLILIFLHYQNTQTTIAGHSPAWLCARCTMHERALCNLPKSLDTYTANAPDFFVSKLPSSFSTPLCSSSGCKLDLQQLAINTTVGSRVEASNDIRVRVQVEVLCRRHVYRHRLINLLAPCTHGRETRPVVRPSGRPLHVAMGRTRRLGWSCVVANANE